MSRYHIHETGNKTTRQACIDFCARQCANANIDLDDRKEVRGKVLELAQPGVNEDLVDYIENEMAGSTLGRSFKSFVTKVQDSAKENRQRKKTALRRKIEDRAGLDFKVGKVKDAFSKLSETAQIVDYGERCNGKTIRYDEGLENFDGPNAAVCYVRYTSADALRLATIRVYGFNEIDADEEIEVVGDVRID